jgi:hypothetical protein
MGEVFEGSRSSAGAVANYNRCVIGCTLYHMFYPPLMHAYPEQYHITNYYYYYT